MSDRRSLLQYGCLLCVFLLITITGCNHSSSTKLKSLNEENTDTEASITKRNKKELEKGYELPVEERERQTAREACQKVMELYKELYSASVKDNITAEHTGGSKTMLSDDTVYQIQNRLKEAGYSVAAAITYANMDNYQAVDTFLKGCQKGKSGFVIIYKLYSNGSLGRMKFTFDGTDMYVLSGTATWNQNMETVLSYISHNRIEEWQYTNKGWFAYQLCVPELPEVTEVFDGSCLIRILPLTKEQQDLSWKCVKGLGYQGNEFESLLMEYLPITATRLREYAAFDEEKQTYLRARLGCLSNYAPTYFGTSLPEVTHIRENEDGTVTLTVDAVCEMMLCDDAVITHELTVQFAEDGSFQYLGNRILNDGME